MFMHIVNLEKHVLQVFFYQLKRTYRSYGAAAAHCAPSSMLAEDT